jgi:acyl-CoA synthetase (AMP-forming)/AMP-acid ligase II
VGRGSRVALMMRNQLEVMDAHYACAALHAVVVNVNVSLAPPELAYILGDSGAAVVVAGAEFGGALAAAAGIAAAEGAAPGAGRGGGAAGAQQQRLAELRAVIWAGSAGQAAAPDLAALGAAWAGVDHLPYPDPAPAEAAAPVPAVQQLEAAGQLASDEDGFHLYYTSGTTGRPKVCAPAGQCRAGWRCPACPPHTPCSPGSCCGRDQGTHISSGCMLSCLQGVLLSHRIVGLHAQAAARGG